MSTSTLIHIKFGIFSTFVCDEQEKYHVVYNISCVVSNYSARVFSAVTKPHFLYHQAVVTYVRFFLTSERNELKKNWRTHRLRLSLAKLRARRNQTDNCKPNKTKVSMAEFWRRRRRNKVKRSKLMRNNKANKRNRNIIAHPIGFMNDIQTFY